MLSKSPSTVDPFVEAMERLDRSAVFGQAKCVAGSDRHFPMSATSPSARVPRQFT